jgi:hypothetical protein
MNIRKAVIMFFFTMFSLLIFIVSITLALAV